MNKPTNCRKFFLWLGIVLISAALSFRGYVEYQKRVHNLNLQIGNSLYPVVSDYFSWSKEEPLKPGELPKRGEFYSYRRPDSAAKKPMEKFYQRLSGGRTATKQCHGVSEDGLLWDTGSDDKWVPVADIVGHVVEIYDSRYKELSKTPEGRFRLWVERHNVKGDYQHWGSYVAVWDGKKTSIYTDTGLMSKTILSYQLLNVTDDGFVLGRWANEMRCDYILYNPATEETVDNVDQSGELMPADITDKTHNIDGGAIATGNLYYAFTGEGWYVSAATNPTQTSTLWVPKQYNLLLIQGGGEADVFLTIKTANETIDLYGNWGQQEVQLPPGPSTVTFTLARHLGEMDSTGGVQKIELH